VSNHQIHPLRAAVLISGGGTTLKNLLEKIQTGSLALEIPLVISSNTQAKGIEIAKTAGIKTEVLARSQFGDTESYSKAIFDAVRAAGAPWVVMGGFLKHVLISSDYENRVINIHPSLIPAFCGAGFYGAKVHQAVLDFGAKVSGCTVHFVDNQFDHGPILLQRVVEVAEGDTVATLAARVFAAECEALPSVINLLAAGHVHIRGRLVSIS
jgi:phosphoribosylglycinamide formyltransferase-1